MAKWSPPAGQQLERITGYLMSWRFVFEKLDDCISLGPQIRGQEDSFAGEAPALHHQPSNFIRLTGKIEIINGTDLTLISSAR